MRDKAHLDIIHALFQGSFRLKMGRVKIYEMLIISHHDPWKEKSRKLILENWGDHRPKSFWSFSFQTCKEIVFRPWPNEQMSEATAAASWYSHPPGVHSSPLDLECDAEDLSLVFLTEQRSFWWKPPQNHVTIRFGVPTLLHRIWLIPTLLLGLAKLGSTKSFSQCKHWNLAFFTKKNGMLVASGCLEWICAHIRHKKAYGLISSSKSQAHLSGVQNG